ncbi:MAG: putative methyltransferase [Candidatus Saccharibacteria bacterium]|nr:putative methyltransferase [Candidatus Saccharibacteria bacterium]
MRQLPIVPAKFDKIVGGGQALATLEDGKKLFAWGALPDEEANVQLTKKKSRLVEGYVTEVLKPSKDRVEPRDLDSYLSTSPWQIMTMEAEQHYKAALIVEAFELHSVVLPNPVEVYTNGREYEYRNKIEFSFWFETDTQQLSLAFFRRGTHGKIAVKGTSLASPVINTKAQEVLAVLNEMKVIGRDLKTLLIRSNANGEVSWQLYVKDPEFAHDEFIAHFEAGERGQVIFSNPLSPASVITEYLTPHTLRLTDTILGVSFNYATEGFFQINIPVYEQALLDMKTFILEGKPVLDLYSGVGTIGLTIGGDDLTLVEMNKEAVREMKNNIVELGKKATAILAASEDITEYITEDKVIILDPPRAGLHLDVIDRLLEVTPERIVYLSCNPVTQARDVALLAEKYNVTSHKGYNFFPRTPHIENLVILDLRK